MPERDYDLLVPEHTAEQVAEHYKLDLAKFNEWRARLANVQIMGAIESPYMRRLVQQYVRFADASDDDVREAYQLDASDTMVESEHTGRGLAQRKRDAIAARNEFVGRGLGAE